MAQPVFTGPTLITGPTDPNLDLAGDTFVVAEYYGQDLGPLTVNEVTFVQNNARLGLPINTTFANPIYFGTSQDATNLALISQNDAWRGSPGFDFYVPTTAGHTYKLQLLFHDNWQTAPYTRLFDVYLAGNLMVPSLDLAGLGAGKANNADVLLTYSFSGDGNPLEIGLYYDGVQNPMISALTLKDLSPNPLPPAFTAVPASQTNFPGRSATFKGWATGGKPLTYQWQAGAIGSGSYTNLSDGGNLWGATTPTLTLTNLTAANAADYVLVAMNATGTNSSPAATLLVVPVQGPVSGSAYASYLYTNYNPVAYWRLSDTASGQMVYDASPTMADGTVVNPASGALLGVPGPRPADGFAGFEATHTALHLPGPTNVNVGAMTTVPINLNKYTTNNATMVAWVKPDGNQAQAATLFFTRTDNNAGNLNNNGLAYNTYPMGDGDYELGYCWNGYDYSVHSGLEVPHNIWSLVATVITPTNATVYVLNATGMRSYSQQDYHLDGAGQKTGALISAVTWAGPTYLGYDPFNNGHGRVFYGSLAELAVLPSALNAEQILLLYGAGVGVSGFAPKMTAQPANAAVGLGATKPLRAAASGTAPLSYQWQVRANGSGAFTNLFEVPNYSGTLTNLLTITGFGPTNVADYRLVVTNAYGAVTSSVATLTLNVPVPDNSYQYAMFTNNPYAYWRLDETNKSPVIWDTSPVGNYSGTPLASASLGLDDGPKAADAYPGFNAPNTALRLAKGSDDGYATFPALNLSGVNNVTMTAWIKPSGPQQGHTGVLCMKGSGDGALTYSANFVDDSGAPVLGYSWNGNDGNWNTGLQPPYGVWSYVALIVTPTDATMLLFSTNGISVSYLVNNHAVTDFLAPGAIGADTHYVNWAGWTGIFDGDIAEVALFNRALSPSQVETLYGKAAGIASFPVAIVQQPVHAWAAAGGSAQLKATALGTGLSYQWQARAIGSSGAFTNVLDGNGFSGAQTATLSITNAAAANVAQFQVVIANAYPSSVTSVPVKFMLTTPLAPALIGEWLNGDSDYADKSGYTAGGVHDGLVWGYGTPSFVADVPAGFTGSSLFLDGASALMITNTARSDADYRLTFDNNINQKFTIAFWVRGFPPHGWYPLVTKGGENSVGWQLRADANPSNGGQNPTFTMRGLSNDDGGDGAPLDLSDGQWHHFAGVFDGTTGIRQLYVDGALQLNLYNIFGSLACPNIDHLVLGAIEVQPPPLTPRWFYGQLFDVRMYSYALNEAEVRSLLRPAAPANSLGLSLSSGSSVPMGHRETFVVTLPAGANAGSSVTVWVTNNAPEVAVIEGATGTVFPVTFQAGTASSRYLVLDIIGPGQIDLTVGGNAGLLAGSATATVNPQLIGQWVNGTPDLADKSGYTPLGTHDGLPVGANYRHLAFSNDVPAGFSGQSLALDGTYMVAIQNSSTLDPNYQPTFDANIAAAFSVSFWAKGIPPSSGTWVGKRGEGVDGWKVRNHNADNSPNFTMRDTTGPDDTFFSSLRIDANWHHYVATWDAVAGRKMYIDGKFDFAVANDYGPLPTPVRDYLTIGGYDDNNGTATPSYTGGVLAGCKMYDVRMYNYALNGSEVKNITSRNTTALVAVADSPIIDLGYTGTLSLALPTGANAHADVTVWVTNVNPGVVSIVGAPGNVFPVTFRAGAYASKQFTLGGLSEGPAQLAFSATGFTGAAATVQVCAPTHLIGHWFAGHANLADHSRFTAAGTHDGLVVGSTPANQSYSTDVPAGFSGRSLSLNNPSFASTVAVLITNTATSDAAYARTFDELIASKFSVTFWAKLNAAYAQGWAPFVTKRGEDNGSFQIRRHGGDNTETFTLRGTAQNGTYGGNDDPNGSVNINSAGVWRHFAAVWDGYAGTRKVYVNGVLDPSINLVNDFGPFTLARAHHLMLGARENNTVLGPGLTEGLDSNTGFNGLLYDVRFYNYALSPAEVATVKTPVALTLQKGPGTTLQLSWPVVSGGDCILQSSSSLTGGWSNCALPVTTVGGQNMVTDTAGAGTTFYRLVLP